MPAHAPHYRSPAVEFVAWAFTAGLRGVFALGRRLRYLGRWLVDLVAGLVYGEEPANHVGAIARGAAFLGCIVLACLAVVMVVTG